MGLGPCLKRIKSFCFSAVEVNAAKSKYQYLLSKPLSKEKRVPGSARPGTRVPVRTGASRCRIPGGGHAAACHLLLGPRSQGCVSLQQWLVNGGHTADLWQNCTSGSVFHCLTSSTNGECSPGIRAAAASCFYSSPQTYEIKGDLLVQVICGSLLLFPALLPSCSLPPFPLASSAPSPHGGAALRCIPGVLAGGHRAGPAAGGFRWQSPKLQCSFAWVPDPMPVALSCCPRAAGQLPVALWQGVQHTQLQRS